MAEAIQAELDRIEGLLGAARCTDANPCGAAAYYDEGDDKPWRIADDHNTARFATADEAADEAEAWADDAEEA
jgi:hypothetical protein